MALDPVCGMEVNDKKPPATAEYEGTTYYFCSSDCKQAFEEDPEEYIASAA